MNSTSVFIFLILFSIESMGQSPPSAKKSRPDKYIKVDDEVSLVLPYDSDVIDASTSEDSEDEIKVSRPRFVQSSWSTFNRAKIQDDLWRSQLKPSSIRSKPKSFQVSEQQPLSFRSRSRSRASQSPDPNPSQDYRIRSIDWHTKNYKNSCHMDAFLTAFMLKVRQTNGDFLNKIQLRDDPVSDSLMNIGIYIIRERDNIKSEVIKKMYVDALFFGSKYQTPIDCGGLESVSIFSKIRNHIVVNLKVKCKCNEGYLQTARCPIDKPSDINGYVNVEYSKDLTKFAPKCTKCKEKRIVIQPQIESSSWGIMFEQVHKSFIDPKDFPKEIIYKKEINGPIIYTFKLQYISYQIRTNQDIGHIVSVHVIHSNYYFSDPLKSTQMSLYRGKDLPHDAKVNSVFYVKK